MRGLNDYYLNFKKVSYTNEFSSLDHFGTILVKEKKTLSHFVILSLCQPRKLKKESSKNFLNCVLNKGTINYEAAFIFF